MTLPFSGLIMSILYHEKVKIPSSWTAMKREDPISTHTLTRSKARLPGNEGERAEGDDTEDKLGNTDEEIDWFILGPNDMEASPTQAQPQEQPQAPVHAPDHPILLLDKFDHFQQS